MKVFYSDHFVLPLPEDHPSPMIKYSMLRERVARDGICGPGELLTPRAVTDQEILRAHAPDYLKRVTSGRLTEKEVRRIGFPWSEKMVERSRRASGGTLGACLGDSEFLATLDRGLKAALDAADADLAIYLAGADPFEGDRLGRLSVTKSGLAERDRIVLQTCRERGIPVAVTMAGGYAREVEDTVDVHFQSISRAADLLDSAADISKDTHLT